MAYTAPYYEQLAPAHMRQWDNTAITYNARVLRQLYGVAGEPGLIALLPTGRQWSGPRHYQHTIKTLRNNSDHAFKMFGKHKGQGIDALNKALTKEGVTRYGHTIGGKHPRLSTWNGSWNLNAFWVDNTHLKCKALQEALNEIVVPYVNEHMGGFVGDAIKQNFFTLGRGTWRKLKDRTIKKKIRTDMQPGKNVPEPAFPLHGETYLPGMPRTWRRYTYRMGWGSRAKRGAFSGVVGSAALYPGAGGRARFMRKTVQKGISGAFSRGTGPMRAIGLVNTKDFKRGWKTSKSRVEYMYPEGRQHTPTGEQKQGIATVYSPEQRMPLMDIVATLDPLCYVTNGASTLADGVKNVKKATKRNRWKKSDKISLSGALEPLMFRAPEVFLHEFGIGKNLPKRGFIAHGIARGMNTGVTLLRKYAGKIMEQAYEDERRLKPRTRMKVQSLFTRMRAMGAKQRKIVEAQEAGKGGDKHLPGYATGSFDPRLERNIFQKRERQKSILAKMMGHYKIWWVLPPSKYYHYIGALADIRGVLTGSFFNIGALGAYIKALSAGIIGARMGSPIAFTPKARRRKFRSGMYERAGYHSK